MIPVKTWTNGTPENNYQDGTELDAADFESWNRELTAVIQAVGDAPDGAKFDQLLAAIKLIAWGVNSAVRPTTLTGFGLLNGVEKDAQGNVGIGCVPKTWDALYPVIQINAKTSVAADVNSSYYGTNWYHAAGAYKRLGDGYSLQYHQNASSGRHIWKVAATAAADSQVAWIDAMTLDAQGNVGIGCTPKTWDAMFPALQLNAKSVITADVNSSYFGTNWYRSAGVYKRLQDGYALMYHQDAASGKHLWKTAPTGTADSAVAAWTAAITLDAATGMLDVPAGITTATPSPADSSNKAATTAWCGPRMARAWVAFNGTTGAIRSSFNVSSVTRNAAGDYTIAFTNQLADTNFAVVPGVGRGATNIDCLANLHHSYARNTANVRIGTTIASQAQTTYYQDMPEVSVTIFGN